MLHKRAKIGAQVYDIARKYPAATPLTTRRFSPSLEIGRLIPIFFISLTASKLFMANKDDNQHVYRVLFQTQGQVYEVYARNIYQSELYGLSLIHI